MNVEARMPEYLERANALNKTDFVRQAIDFYMGYLDSQSSVDFIAPIISNCIQDNIDKPVKDIGEVLYNVAVELAVLNNLIAFCYDIDKDNIDDVYELCKREVAKTNGLFDFRRAHRLQNQEQYNQWQR